MKNYIPGPEASNHLEKPYLYKIMNRKDQDGEPFKTIEIFDHFQWIELKRNDPLRDKILLWDLEQVEHD